MVEVSVRYTGNLRCEATHGPSGAAILTDAPTDNHGKGEAFSPTDLLAAALPACMMTIMGIVAERHGIRIEGMTARASKHMSADAPRRIARIVTTIRVPLPATHPHRDALERAAHTCPVHKSLRADIDAPVDFVWEGGAS